MDIELGLRERTLFLGGRDREKRRSIKANTGFDMKSAHPKCETCTRNWNIDTVNVVVTLSINAKMDLADFQNMCHFHDWPQQ